MLLFLRRALPPLIILALFAAAAAYLISTQQEPEQKAEDTPLPIIDVKQVEQQTMSLNLPSYGVVQPKFKTQLVTEVKGRLLSISTQFAAGGMVKQGDELATIEPSDYEADLIQAQATLAQAIAALDEEKARGEVAKNDWKGYKNGVAPQLGLRLPQLKKEQANVKYAQAALARAERNLQRTVIRAPFDGLIKARHVDLGQYVSQGTNLGELYDIAVAEIRLPVANEDLAYLESVDNPDTEVTLSASLAGKTVSWQGEIIRSEGVIDTENRMVYLVAEVIDPYLKSQHQAKQLPLKYGSFVTATIKGRTLDGIVKLPRHLVKNGQVAVIGKNNIVEFRTVNSILTDLEFSYVRGSLHTGERIAITSLNKTLDGRPVKILGEASPQASTPDEVETPKETSAAKESQQDANVAGTK
ncbi:efflux RND transporter periplasmic adaptor subunit [Shewanella gelidii]|uniref:efflux RND transporter periplasmic adaptor subunit n=1 Tax=Shewanella gelidii TaxID=1642821 RepID=UPI003570EECF